ncbi:RNA exonuclease 1 homolog [Neocloeon triangulifer]|uniref:RNA exonuclease 1 homolog n=1 Tax=Neocloeon triangulifer TaxID=2078957 RepID=UPI00286EB7FA|nr:RNA exonuclease 1 homolog [Neocloeon triangulifer]
MLPSKGKFSLYPCPHLPLSSCGRPYCPFSHTLDTGSSAPNLPLPQQRATDKVDIIPEKEATPVTKHVSSSPPPLAAPTPIVIKTEPDDDDLIPQLEALFGMEGAPDLSRIEQTLFETPQYEPTPISELKNYSKTSVIETLSTYDPQENSKPLKVEEYVPLPIKVEQYEPIAPPEPESSYVPTKKSTKHNLSASKKSSSPSSSKTSTHISSSKSGSSSKHSSSKSKSDSTSKKTVSDKTSSSSKSSLKSSEKSSKSSSSHSKAKSSDRKSSESKRSRSVSSSSEKTNGEKRKKYSPEPCKSKEILISSDDEMDYTPTTVILDNDSDDEDIFKNLKKKTELKPKTSYTIPKVTSGKDESDDDIFKDVKSKTETAKQAQSSTKTSTAKESNKRIVSDSDYEVGQAADEENYSVPDKKRRVAHMSRFGFQPKTTKKVIRPVVSSVGVVLAERWKKQQELKLNANQDKLSDDDKNTRVGCAQKGKARVAHQTKPADAKTVARPKITPSPSKVPAVKRQYVLDQLFDMCVTIYEKQDDAVSKALELELAILAKATTSNVYTSVFISQKRLLEKSTMPPPLGTGLLCIAPSAPMRHITTMGADSKIERINVFTRTIEVKGEFLYKLMSSYLLSKDELKEHGFPLPDENDRRRALIHAADDKRRKLPNENQRECCRCGSIYVVNNKGMPGKLSLDELCIYHPKRTYKKRRDRTTVEDYYMCCDRPFSSEGCESNVYHISENPHFDHLTGFVRAQRSSRPKQKTGVYALDCEMCLTTNGTECTRVTIIDEHRNNIYDALVKPDVPVLDYLTRFSGITEEMLNSGNTKTLKEVQREILQIIRAETILIGHSLQGDLKVLKMIHKNVVDTSIVFPHREGLPKRRALKNLAKDYLMRLIQVDESGHDSSEDALACMDLMLFKAKEDAKSHL